MHPPPAWDLSLINALALVGALVVDPKPAVGATGRVSPREAGSECETVRLPVPHTDRLIQLSDARNAVPGNAEEESKHRPATVIAARPIASATGAAGLEPSSRRPPLRVTSWPRAGQPFVAAHAQLVAATQALGGPNLTFGGSKPVIGAYPVTDLPASS